MRPRIGLDARFVVRNRRGIGNYSLELIRAFAKQPRGFDYFLFTDGPDPEGLLPTAAPFHQIQLGLTPYPLWEQLSLPLACGKYRIDLLHCLGMTAPFLLPPDTKLVSSIHDVIYMLPKDQFGSGNTPYQAAGRVYRKLIIPSVARHASHIITISEFSRSEIQKYIPGVRESDITVTPLAASTSFLELLASTMGVEAPATPYLLHLGAADPRKNTRAVIQSFLETRESLRPDVGELVIAGLDPKYFLQIVHSLPQSLWADADRYVRLPGFVSESELVALYRGAKGLLFPSKFEGFGIPILEAMHSGVPVITASVTSLPEVAGGAAILVDPESVSSLSKALLDLIHIPGASEHYAAAGLARAASFTWDRTAALTLDVYEAVLGLRQEPGRRP